MKAILFTAGAVLTLLTAAIGLNGSTATATSETCASANDRSNIVYTWNGDDKISVSLKRPVCSDLTLYFSSYEMPDTWDQKGFNATAVPQVWKASDHVTFKANDAVEIQSMSVALPDACKNAQIDLYFGPEIVNLPNTGHGAQFIANKYQHKKGDCQPVTPVTPVTPTTPQTPTTPTQLPHTGPVSILAILAPTVAALTYIGLSLRNDLLARSK